MRISRFAVVGVAGVITAGCIAYAQAQQPRGYFRPAAVRAAPSAAPQPPPPLPDWQDADFADCSIAATPGEMHAYLAKSVGVWSGEATMWLAPGAEPTLSQCTVRFTSILDGRFTKCEWAGEMPGMGPFNGFGLFGFDNVGQQFQSTWADTCGTGMLTGTGKLAPGANAISWTYSYRCPLTGQPAVLHEIERSTGPDTKRYEMYGTDLKSGREFKMLEVALRRLPAG